MKNGFPLVRSDSAAALIGDRAARTHWATAVAERAGTSSRVVVADEDRSPRTDVNGWFAPTASLR